MPPHPLDRPAWNALAGGWAELAERSGAAVRLNREHGPFAATADGSPDSLLALLPLLRDDEESWLVEVDPPVLPDAIRTLSVAPCVQMVATAIAEPALACEPLGDADAAEMQALAALTRPGPFRRLTHRLGRFVGIRADGRLVAMAGERMRLDGFVEVSGVCTHPDHRGHGLAGGLMRHVAARILAEGDTPFLHAYASNTGAIALYEALGFRTRAIVTLTALSR